MECSVFDFQTYREYLLAKLRSLPKRGYGAKARLAAHIQCQAAYVSQVLNGIAHLSFEQAERTNRFLAHSKEEAHFFLLLVSKDRAGTDPLREYYQHQIDNVLQKRLVLKNRIGVSTALSEEDKYTYYGQWYYVAIHIALMVPELQTRDALAEHFALPKKKILDVLQFLTRSGLAIEENSRYRVGTTRIHLGSDSPLVPKNHISWRMRAIQSLERDAEADLHYTSVMSLSKKDVAKIKEELIKKIQDVSAIVRDSKEETLQCLALDFFDV